MEEVCGTTRQKIKEMYNKLGDLGDVAQEIRQTQALLAPPSPILINHLCCILREIRYDPYQIQLENVNFICSCSFRVTKMLAAKT